jgi:hypothetical protein
MRERRKEDKRTAGKYMVVYDCLTKQSMGELVNLSSEGAMLVTPNPIKASTSFQCRVELWHPIMERHEIYFAAECRWCRKNVQADRWESGYRLAVAGIDAELISYLILGFKLCGWGEADMSDVKTAEIENRRNSVRYEFDDRLPVYESDSYRQVGELADLSIHGFRIVASKPSAKGKIVKCRVKLPKKIFQHEFLLLEAECMWCRESGDHYESGYSTVNISKADTAVILHLLIHCARVQDTKRRGQVVW